MYLPLAGLIALAAAGAWAALARLQVPAGLRRGLGVALAAAVVVGYGAATVRRNAVYRSELALWADVFQHRPDNPVAHINLGKSLALDGQPDAAVRHYAEAVRLEPGYAEAYNNWALLLQAQRDGPGAERLLRHALALKPAWAELHYNLGNLLAQEGRLSEAAAAYARALELEPGLAEAHTNWGNVLWLQGDVAGAASHYRRALTLNPLHADARRNLILLQGQGR
jgi:Flp pilus assembly protein TadD